MTKIKSLAILSVLFILLFSAGCTTTPQPEEVPVNVTPTLPVLHRGTIAVNLSEIEVLDSRNFTGNLTSAVAMVLAGQRGGLLLDNGWNITSVQQEYDEKVLNRPYVLVELENNGLSFYILVDDLDKQILDGYSGAKPWLSSSVSGPLPKDYSRSFDKATRRWYVFDNRPGSDREYVMIYNRTGIYNLDPDF